MKTSRRASASVATNERPPVNSASFSRSGMLGPSTSPSAGRSRWGSMPRRRASDSPDRDRMQGDAQVAGQHCGLHGIERLRTGRLVVAVGQEHEHLLLRRRNQESIETHSDRIADVGSVVLRPRHGARSPPIRSGTGGRGSEGTPARDNWQTQPARSDRPTRRFDKLREGLLSRPRDARSSWYRGPSGNRRVFMLELWSSATTIATPCPAILVTPPTVCGRASATARAPIARPHRKAGNWRSQTQLMRRLSGKPSRLGHAMRGRARSSSQGKWHEDHEPEPSGLSESHHKHPRRKGTRLYQQVQHRHRETRASRAASARSSAVSGSWSSTVIWPIFRPGTADCLP